MRHSTGFKLKLAVASILGLLATKYAKAETGGLAVCDHASGQGAALCAKGETSGMSHSWTPVRTTVGLVNVCPSAGSFIVPEWGSN